MEYEAELCAGPGRVVLVVVQNPGKLFLDGFWFVTNLFTSPRNFWTPTGAEGRPRDTSGSSRMFLTPRFLPATVPRRAAGTRHLSVAWRKKRQTEFIVFVQPACMPGNARGTLSDGRRDEEGVEHSQVRGMVFAGRFEVHRIERNRKCSATMKTACLVRPTLRPNSVGILPQLLKMLLPGVSPKKVVLGAGYWFSR